jgi:antitoxin VapB
MVSRIFASWNQLDRWLRQLEGLRIMETAKVFWSGRSQAVRLPRAFRVDGREVRIRRRGRAIVLEPVPESWEWLDALAGEVAEDFVSAVREQPEATERPDLGKVFR